MTTTTIPDSLHDRASFFFAALSVLMSRSSNGPLPELLYFMNPDQVLTFLNTFGGSTIRVPTVREFGDDMRVVLAAYYRYTAGLTDQAVQDRLRLNDSQWKIMRGRMDKWLEFVRTDVGVDPKRLMAA